MPDILDEILEMLPPSTLDIISRQDFDSIKIKEDFNEISDRIECVHLSQALFEIQRENLRTKTIAAEYSNLLSKILNELKLNESNYVNCDFEKNAEAFKKKLMSYDAQIKEIENKFKNVDCAALFRETEKLNVDIEELKANIIKVKSSFECFEGIPPSIEGAKLAIENIKKHIKSNEEKAEELCLV